MNEFMDNRYVKISVLALGIAILIYLLLFFVFMALGMDNFPQFLRVVISLGGAGLIVSKYLAFRVG